MDPRPAPEEPSSTRPASNSSQLAPEEAGELDVELGITSPTMLAHPLGGHHQQLGPNPPGLLELGEVRVVKALVKNNFATRRRNRELVARKALVMELRSGVNGIFDFEVLEDAEDAEWQAAVFNYARFHGIPSDLVNVQELVMSSAGISGWASARLVPRLLPRTGRRIDSPTLGLKAQCEKGSVRESLKCTGSESSASRS